MQRELTKTSDDLLYLINCSLHNTIPDRERVCGMDIAELFKYSKYHTLVAITYDALELLGNKALFADNESEGNNAKLSADGLVKQPQYSSESPVEVLKKWKELRDMAFRKNLMLDSERHKLSAYLCEKKVWHIPLKGVVLKELYPKLEMRQMADNDILFDAEYEETVRDYFVENGYEVVLYNKGNHDVYKKNPVFNYEMHTSLFSPFYNEVWYSYYSNIKEKLVRQGDGYVYAFSDNDFYIYFVTHAFKHSDGSGTGIRSFVDCYVYQSSKTLDWNYIETELNKLGILEFEKTFRSVSWKIFGDRQSPDSLTAEEYDLLCDSMYAGTYGTMCGRIEKNLQREQGDKEAIKNSTKVKYILRRLFPPLSFYESYYPTVYRIKILIPFAIIYRFIKGATIKRKIVMKEAKFVHKVGK